VEDEQDVHRGQQVRDVEGNELPQMA